MAFIAEADAIDQCFLALRNANAQWILEGDIKACFDTISKDWLSTHVPMDKVILRKMADRGLYGQTRPS